MKRFSTRMVATVGMALVFVLPGMAANPPSGSKTGTAPPRPSGVAPGGSGYRPPTVITIRQPPVRVTPPVRITPPVVTTTTPPAWNGFYGGFQPAMNCWVGYNPTTGRYSVAFDSPGIDGMSILMKAGYSIKALGPTTWTGAVAYMRSVGALGW